MGIPFGGQGVVAGWLGREIGFGYPHTSKLLVFDPEGDMQNPEVFDGKSTSSALGCAISPAGDLNGDGEPDFIVGERMDTAITNDERGLIRINMTRLMKGKDNVHFGTALAGGRIR